jgi:hypothetical protein
MKSLYNIIAISLLFFLSAACQSPRPKFDKGHIVNNTYTNNFFKLIIPLPPSWFSLSESQIKMITEINNDLVAGDDKTISSGLKAYAVNNATLLYLTKHELGSDVLVNPSFVLLIENLHASPGVKTGKDYLAHAKRFMEFSNLNYVFLSADFQDVVISNRVFHFADISLNFFGTEFFQTMYVTVINGFALTFALTYSNLLEKFELENILIETVFLE